MPKKSKRRLQLEKARDIKCKKARKDTSEDYNTVNDCNTENIPINEFAAEDNIVTSESTEENNTDTGTSESLMDEVVESAISDNNIFQQYPKDYIEGLHRDDVRSIVIILYYVLTSKLNFPCSWCDIR